MNFYTLQQRYRAGSARRGQGGFTMVELAIVLVIAGIILVGALKGTDMINKAKIERTVNDIKGIQTMVFEHEKRKGRLAGDCDGDGIIGVKEADLAVGALAGSVWDDAIIPTEAAKGKACADTAATSEADLNTPWNDMRKANIVDPTKLNRLLAKNQTNNYYAIGNLTIAGTPSNVIVIYGVPLWMAKGIDVAIDGATPGESGGRTGRIRLLVKGATTADKATTNDGADWPSTTDADKSEETLVSIYYQFDRASPDVAGK